MCLRLFLHWAVGSLYHEWVPVPEFSVVALGTECTQNRKATAFREGSGSSDGSTGHALPLAVQQGRLAVLRSPLGARGAATRCLPRALTSYLVSSPLELCC